MRQLKTDWRIIITYLILLGIGIPWYWPEENILKIFGMPAWVTIAIVVSVLVSILTAYLLLTYQWSGEEETPTESNDE